MKRFVLRSFSLSDSVGEDTETFRTPAPSLLDSPCLLGLPRFCLKTTKKCQTGAPSLRDSRGSAPPTRATRELSTLFRPFRAHFRNALVTQGVALGFLVAARWA